MNHDDDQLPLHPSVSSNRVSAALPLHVLADEIRSIVNEELRWGNPDGYTQRRCERLIRIAAEMTALSDERDADTIEEFFRGDLLHVSPYCGGDAAIFDERGRVLLIQRADDGLWAMPGGALEVGETPAEGACREAWEETGVEVEPVLLSGVYDSRRCGSRTPYHLYHSVFVCRPRGVDAEPRASNETLGAGWFSRQGLPPLSPGHGKRLDDAYRRWKGEIREAAFDPIDL